jgi:predicted metal-binding membrane protein
MTSTLHGTGTSPAPTRVLPLAAAPWMLPALGTMIGWSSVALLARTHGHGHAHHLLGIAAMSVAMMSPLAYPACLAAARSSLWPSSSRCVAAAFGAFLAVWVAAGSVLHVATELVLAVVPTAALAAALAGWCAVDAVSRRRTQRLSACAVTRPLLPGAATSGAIDLGATSGLRCLGTCWAVMALAVALPVLAVPVAAIILVERLVEPRPRWTMATAFALVAVAALATIWR